MNKFKVGYLVEVTVGNAWFRAGTRGIITLVTDGSCVLVKSLSDGEEWFQMSQDLKHLVHNGSSKEYYMLEYMEKNGDFSREDFDSKEEALESIEENSHEIDFDEPVKLLVISKVYNVQKTKRFELVEE